jgi:predicted nucleic acid-binding protein
VSVLDTTFFIDLFRRDTGAARLWETIRLGEVHAAYSSVTVFELWLVRLSAQESEFYEQLMVALEEVALTAAAAKTAASWLRELPSAAAERLIRDAMVAASAYERGDDVYTRNQRDFSRFSEVEVKTY